MVGGILHIRKRLDRFFHRLENYNTNFRRVRELINEIVIEETQLAFPSFEQVFPEFKIEKQGSPTHIHIGESLLKQKHPEKRALETKKEHEDHKYYIVLSPTKSGKRTILRYDGDTKRAFDKMWNVSHQKVEENSDVQAIRREYPRALFSFYGIFMF